MLFAPIGGEITLNAGASLGYLALKNEALDSELGVRAKWTDVGLLVCSRIEDAPDKGTFQTVFLEDCSGHSLGPS